MSIFSRIWPTLPPGMRRCGIPTGERAFDKEMKRVTVEHFEAGLNAYIENKEEWRDWMHFSTFCNKQICDIPAEDYEEDAEPIKPSLGERLEYSRNVVAKLKVVKR